MSKHPYRRTGSLLMAALGAAFFGALVAADLFYMSEHSDASWWPIVLVGLGLLGCLDDVRDELNKAPMPRGYVEEGERRGV